MPLFLSDDEYERCSHDASLVAEKADAFIRELQNQLETVKAQADAAAITAEQTCSLLEQKYVSLSSEFASLESQNSQLTSALEQRLSELAQVQAEKHQIYIKTIEKDGEIERLSTEVSELHKSKRQLIELLEQKDLEISEKNAAMKSYLDKIVNMSDNAALREARLNEIEAELARCQASCNRLSQEKDLIERHNTWLNEELTAKVNSLIELRKANGELEADMSAKIAELERKLNDSLSSLKWYKDRVMELEMKLTSVQEELILSKDAAASNEERYSAEISTVTKLVELYKESSEEWSKKSGELEGVIRALETHLSQVENDYKERLEKETSSRKEFEKEAANLKEKVEKCEAEVESCRKRSELNLLPRTTFTAETWVDLLEGNDTVEDNRMVIPSIPAGVSGTALAASLLRDGWSLAKMYAKYQEAVDALRHEQLGRKQSQAILERVLYEIEEKAGVILDERAEHERLVEAYSVVNLKLQSSHSEQNNLERSIQELKADLKRRERDYSIAQKEIIDLQKQVTILLKECRDVQLRCGSVSRDDADDNTTFSYLELNADSDAERAISERLLTFKDINGLVEQNAQLRSLVRNLSDQIGNREMEIKESFEIELHKRSDEAAAKVNTVLARAEEQGRMIESLHTSVAMYKRLYEEEHKFRSSHPRTAEAVPDNGSKDLMLLLEDSQDSSKKAKEEANQHLRCLEGNMEKLRSEMISLRSERDKFALEANFACEKLDRFVKESEHQRHETNAVLSRNVEFSQLIVDYQRKLRESSESLHVAEDLSRKLTMEVSVLKHEKEMLLNSERRACDEVRSLSERVYRLQASLDTIHSAEEVREEARRAERRKLEEYKKEIEKDWVEAKKQLQEERDNVRRLMLDREETMKNAMRPVEEMGKELANALTAAAAAESRATVAEARYSDIERKTKSLETQIAGNNGERRIFSSLTNEATADVAITGEEIEKLREEAKVNKDHMLQYKSIAQVNEAALKQMEIAHENFKIEADKVRMSLEAELLTVRERVSELERNFTLKSKEAATLAAEREAAVASAMSEIDRLKQECSVTKSQNETMEIQMSALKKYMEEEHQRWRDAQTNYERQVVLQSETIQELTKTSQTLGLLQKEASELRRLADALKTEKNEIKARWEGEKSMLEESKADAEKKYNEINEQNKILHSRLEAFHIKLAEKDRNSAGLSSGSSSQDPVHDIGLQNVVVYLRRSKEIAETEISLLKQEKLRLQSQLESALKAAEIAQASLHAERAHSRAKLFTDEEFKSLQLQVREVNLLRESNIQLREENKHNFEECQKLREVAQKARRETEHLESLLRERQTEMEACRKELEMQKMEKDHLAIRVDELLGSVKNIDVEDYNRLREDIQRIQISMSDKDARLKEIEKLLSGKQVVISELEQELARCRVELNERESRVNESLQVEVSLKADVEKQKKLYVQLKRKFENLSKEKEELSKENQALSKQLEDYRQGRRGGGDAASEHAMKEKEKEKDTRIQILEKTVERQREELKKERDDHKTEKAKRLKTERVICDSIKSVNQEKSKLVDGLEQHKQALKRLSDEFEKVRHAKSSLPEILPGALLDDLYAAYLSAVDNFERVAHLVSSELGAPLADISPVADASSSGLAIGQAVPSQTPIILPAVQAVPSQTPSVLPAVQAVPSVTPSILPAVQAVPSVTPSVLPAVSSASTLLPAKPTEERDRKIASPKTTVEARKAGRKLVRPRIIKPEEPQGDTEMPELEGSNNDGRPASTHNSEIQGSLTLLTNRTIRKRLASSTSSELQEESLAQRDTSSDVAAPVLKKSKGSDFPQDTAEGQTKAVLENLENLPAVEEPSDVIGDLPQGTNEDVMDVGKDNVETSREQGEEPKVGGANQVELQTESNDVVEELLYEQNESEGVLDDSPNVLAEQDIQQSAVESGSEREEGELASDVDSGGNMSNIVESQEVGENQPEPAVPPVSSPVVDEGAPIDATVDLGEPRSPQLPNDEVDMAEVNAEDSPAVAAETQDGKEASPVGTSSTTINIPARALERSVRRWAGVGAPPRAGRPRGRAAGRRGGRPGGR